MRLNGKTAVVTGGGRGIGRAFSERLASDGANIVVLDLEEARDVAQTFAGPGQKLALACDVSDPHNVKEVSRAILAHFGRCDIFVNNAAYMPMASLASLTSDVWRRVQATNVEPIVHFAQQFVPGMKAAGWGRIVTTGSSITLHPQTRDLAYMTSKGSVHGLTRALANELADTGITVNSIAPTMIKTEGLLARTPSDGPTADEIVQRIASQQTIQRPSVPEDLVGTLSFLVSDDAAFITGQVLHVDGGRTRSGA